MREAVPVARKVPKKQISWEKIRKRRVEVDPSPPEEEKLLPSWMKARRVILVILAVYVSLTLLAFFVIILRYAFVVAGIGIMVGAYFIGGGISEWHSVPGQTTHSARSMLRYRYKGSASNWQLITGGVIIGGMVFLAGVVAILLGMFF